MKYRFLARSRRASFSKFLEMSKKRVKKSPIFHFFENLKKLLIRESEEFLLFFSLKNAIFQWLRKIDTKF